MDPIANSRRDSFRESKAPGREPLDVEILDPKGAVRRVTLGNPPCVIGRSKEAQVQLPSEHVSRRHAELYTDPFGRWWVRDLGSHNGTLVNGTTVKEQVLSVSDRIIIGDYRLRLVPTSPPEDETTLSGTRVVMSGGDDGRLTSLGEVEAPRVAREHLTQLMNLSRELQEVAAPRERYARLCQLLISPEFHGQWAAVLRVAVPGASPVPQLLCEPQVAPSFHQEPYISRGLVHAVCEKREALMAARTSGGAVDVELSMVGQGMPMAAVACPVEHDHARVDLLYAILPPQYATGEWLALAGLATEEFRHAQAARRARQQETAHAALEHELDRARHIQMSLVPKDVAHPGLDLGIGFAPCRWVGGDYVDIVTRPDGRVILAVADVCGKGLHAAMLAASLHTGVHSNLAAGANLATLMTNLNNYLYQTIPPSSFVTMVVLSMDPQTGTFEYVNAGHPPPMIVEPGNPQAVFLPDAENLPLGIAPGEMASQTAQVAVGQLLALYTDGLTELTTTSGEMLGLEGLAAELQAIYTSAAVTAGAGVEALNQRLSALLGGELPQDDRTFLLIKRQ